MRAAFRFTVGLLVCVWPVLSASPQTSDNRHVISPRLAELKKHLDSGNASALQVFWDQVAAQGTPLVDPLPGDTKHVLVTFLWRAQEPVRNVVVFSWFGWEEGSRGIAQNKMENLPGTDLWYKTYRARNNIRSSYRLSPNDSLVPWEDVKPEEMRERTSTWQPDPLNSKRHFYPHSVTGAEETDTTRSVVELPRAAPQPWIQPQPGVAAGKVEEHRFTSKILGGDRRIWIYTPASYQDSTGPYGLLILFDGWWYRSWMSATTTVDNLIAKAGLPPLVAVMIDQPGGKLRYRDLGCSPSFNAFLAEELVPWIRSGYRVTSDPAGTIVGGLSRGGLAAACAAFEHPELFGNVLAQSGYFSWKSGDENEEFDDAEYGWIIRQYATAPRLPIRFYLDVGILESGFDGLLMPTRHMRDVLQAKGYAVFYREFGGGHDFEAWQGTLADGLLLLRGSHASTSDKHKSR